MKSRLKGDHKTWESLYRHQAPENLPWFYPGLDPDFSMALSIMDIHSGSVLDLCTGPGTQALALAERGFSVTASDISDTAVRQACEKAHERGFDITFRQNDIFDSRLEKTFDYVIDRGCYHNFRFELRKQYPESVSDMLNPRGYLFLKCFSHLEESMEGPYHIAPEEIQEVFDPLFEVITIKDTVFQSHVAGRNRFEPKALFCVMRRR